jgi:tubulin monoglycylase TTLL3/8
MFNEKIKPQMKRIACWTMMGAKNNIKDRPNSYEVFGIDYMIDTNFNTWLIEINKNPALEYSTVRSFCDSLLSFLAHNRKDVSVIAA